MEATALAQELGEVKAKVEKLELEAEELKIEIKVETDREEELAKRAELASLNSRIGALENRIAVLQKWETFLLVQSQGIFLFVRVEWYFLLAAIFSFPANIYFTFSKF